MGKQVGFDGLWVMMELIAAGCRVQFLFADIGQQRGIWPRGKYDFGGGKRAGLDWICKNLIREVFFHFNREVLLRRKKFGDFQVKHLGWFWGSNGKGFKGKSRVRYG